MSWPSSVSWLASSVDTDVTRASSAASSAASSSTRGSGGGVAAPACSSAARSSASSAFMRSISAGSVERRNSPICAVTVHAGPG